MLKLLTPINIDDIPVISVILKL